MADPAAPYAARLDIDYPEQLERLSSFFRLIWAIPILVILGLLEGPAGSAIEHAGKTVGTTGGGAAAGLFIATLLMILFRGKYPRWWFDFVQELARFATRVGAYLLLLTDTYPSTDEAQSVHLDIDYPDVERDLNRWLPLVKWLLAIPHYIVLVILGILAILAVIIAWFAILFTGRYPRGLFDFVVGVMRWSTRVWAYMLWLVTDRYPPFSLR
jgi:Domain of unknown function (DUF4389)